MIYLNKGCSLNWAAPQISRRTGDHLEEARTPSRLVSIILATKSSRGQSIVFHYPPEVDKRVADNVGSYGNVQDADDDIDDDFLVPPSKFENFDQRTDGHLPTIQERNSGQDDAEERWVPPWRTILGLEAPLLADILTPQVSNQRFEMWIDNLVFIGNPVQLKNAISDAQSGDKYPSYIGRVSATETGLSTRSRKDSSETARLGQSEITDSENGFGTSTSVPSPLTTFHLVFALDASMDELYHDQMKALYENVVRRLTSALADEEAKDEYIWRQCEMMRAIRIKAENSRTNIATVWHDLVSQCNLAEVIKQTFDSIVSNRVAHLLINHEHKLSLAIPHSLTTDSIPKDNFSYHPYLNSAVSFGITLDDADPMILPYYALILLDDTERILAALASRASELLKRLVIMIHPEKDFHALAEGLQCPLQAVLTVAQDLIRWRCAMPIPPLHGRNVYTTSPTADKTRLPQQIIQFSKVFPEGPSLPDMLEKLSLEASPYNNLIPKDDQVRLYMDMLAWLLRSGWLIQLRTFVWVKIRAEIKAAVMSEQMEDGLSNNWDSQEGGLLHDEMFADSIIADPYNATKQESIWLKKLATFHPVADAALFSRACKYFNGKHAIEKIVVREGIDPKALRRLLEVFDEDLVKSHTW